MTEEEQKSQTEQPIFQFEEDESSSSSSSSEEEDEEDEEEYASDVGNTVYKGESWAREDASDISPDDNSAEANIKRFMRVIQSRRVQRRIEEDEKEYEFHEDLFDFPRDPENWMEEDLEELWADAPLGAENPGWDPVWADEEDWEIVNNEISEGRDPPIAPFYVPYRQSFPAIPDNHYDISNPKSVIEELDRIEEFLVWGSYIFADGSSYEGTVWDDLAHGKGVYVAEDGLVRYEGEWLQNNMEGHGVVEVEIPTIQPIPGSKLEAKMRAEGQIITRDFMSPEDKEWLEMDIEDSMLLADGRREIPFEENDLWIKIFGSKPEKGRYKYAGQWKHGRMHGCGVYEVNERVLYGRFYFGQLLEDSSRCNADIAGLHAGIAEVAAAKARMFVNKPDGMVWEEKGPYTDPQHPYFYEDDDVWMAPGFINQFYDVPDYWKTYVKEVDQEMELWLNSFYKAPLRIPMPAELEYWWSHDDSPEFVLINKEPEVDPEDPSKLIYTDDPLILHTRTGRLINFTEDEKYGVRLFWQPQLEDGEDVDPEKATFLPLGFDEYYGHVVEEKKKEGNLQGLFSSVRKAFQPFFDGIGKWVEEKKKASEMNLKLIEQELEFIEAQLCLEEEMEDLEMELRRKEEEEEKKASEEDLEEEDVPVSFADHADQDQKVKVEEGEEEEKEEEEAPPQSFGFVPNGLDSNVKDDDSKKNQFGKSSKPFASFSLSLMGSPNKLQDSFLSWQRKSWLKSSAHQSNPNYHPSYDMVSFPYFVGWNTRLTATRRPENVWRKIPVMHSIAKVKLKPHSVKLPENQTPDILSLCIPLQSMMLNQDGMLMSSC